MESGTHEKPCGECGVNRLQEIKARWNLPTLGGASVFENVSTADIPFLIEKLEKAIECIKFYEEAGPELLSMVRREKAREFLQEMEK